MTEGIRSTIEGALHAALKPIVFETIEIVSGHDHADEEALFIVVELPSSTPPIDGDRYLSTVTGVSDALLAIGERRFPYVKLRRLDSEGSDEGVPDRAISQ